MTLQPLESVTPSKEISRPWDPEMKFMGAVIKVYPHWCLEVSFSQHTLGCFIIFSRHNVERYSQLPSEALVELGQVTREIETVLSSDPRFRPDRFNYLQMGNAVHHLHVHGVPRYLATREFHGIHWVDPTPGDPPTWTKNHSKFELITTLRERFSRAISELSNSDQNIYSQKLPGLGS